MWNRLQRNGTLPIGKPSETEKERIKQRRKAFKQADKKEWGLIQINKPRSLKPFYVPVDTTKTKH